MHNPPVLAFLDVDYRTDSAVAACVLAGSFADPAPAAEWVERIAHVEPYEPGAFYKRELPCLLAVLRRAEVPPSLVVIDGYVWLGSDRPGLGAHLHEALGRATPVVGVAKTAFRGAVSAVPVHRGGSARPLFVTAAGVDTPAIARAIEAMHGPFRIPTLLRRVDRLCRDG